MVHADYLVRTKDGAGYLSGQFRHNVGELAQELLRITNGRQYLVGSYPLKTIQDGVDGYDLDVYDFNGSAVMVTEDWIKIISPDAKTLERTKADLEEKLAHFRLVEVNQK